MNLALLAARNLSRNRRRTALTIGGISIGLGIMHTANNFAGGSYGDLLDTAISSMAGHVVVQGAGWQKSRESAITVQRSGEVSQTLHAEYPDAVITRRAMMDGLLMSPSNAVGAMLTAVEPAPEAAVNDLDDKLIAGTWLDGDDTSLLVGANMAEALGVAPGDKLVFMTQEGGSREGSGGEMTSRLFRVKGVFQTGANELDGFVAYGDLRAAAELLGGDDPATQVALHLRDARQTGAATAAIQTRLNRPDVEVLPWQLALAELNSFLELDARYNDVMFAIIGLMVAMGVLNTVLMSVLERTRELGVMLALGLRPGRLTAMVLLEGLFIGLIGASVGFALGALGTLPLVHYGVDFSEQFGGSYETAGVPMNMHIFARYDWSRMALYSVIAVAATVLASLWPAFKVSRLRPVEAIHHQ